MSHFVQIQPRIFCEPCKDCGARPVVEQVKGRFIVRCPNDSKHYKTKPGLVDVKAWNNANKAAAQLTNLNTQKAS